jgi:hypothetical protein
MPIEVMPICTTERNASGPRAASWPAGARIAGSTITCSLALRLAVSAISDMANSELRKIRKEQ